MSEYSNFDWNQLYQQGQNATYEALPVGDYQAECTKAEATRSSNGKPMIKATFKVTEGAYVGKNIMTQFTLSVENETALSIFFRQMKALGMDQAFFARVPPGQLGPVASHMVGKRVTLTLAQREWQGEMRNEVKSVKAPLGVAAGVPATLGASMPQFVPQPGAPVPPMMQPMQPAPAPQPTFTQPPAPQPTAYAQAPAPAPQAPAPAPAQAVPASVPVAQPEPSQVTEAPLANIQPNLPI